MSDGYLTGEEVAERLKELGVEIRAVDELLLSAIAARMELALQVGATKARRRDNRYPNGEPISRPEVEARRLDDIAKLAPAYGVDPNLVRAILYILIGESCKRQMRDWQMGNFEYHELTYEQLKTNLLELAAVVARDYRAYGQLFPATRLYRAYEEQVILSEVGVLLHRGHSLDLGCGGGQILDLLTVHFERTTGVDISPEMIQTAKGNTPPGTRLVTADLEDPSYWATIPDSSCSFLVMGLGTASALRDVDSVMGEIGRVLEPGGRFVLSFYNREGLVHRGGFQPWVGGLATRLDIERDHLVVHADGRTFTVFNRPWTGRQVRQLVENTGKLFLHRLESYPTIATLLPGQALANPRLREVVEASDRRSAMGPDLDGAYIIAAGHKR